MYVDLSIAALDALFRVCTPAGELGMGFFAVDGGVGRGDFEHTEDGESCHQVLEMIQG